MYEPIQGFRLSPQQSHLWELPQGAGRWARCEIRITGDVDVSRLRGALAELLQVHEILRTGFQGRPGLKKPIQVVANAGRLDWVTVDLRTEAPQAAEERVAGYFGEAGNGGLAETAEEPRLEAVLFALPGDAWSLVVSLPVARSDRGSLANLFREIVRAYAGAAEGEPEALQYVQFSEWQNDLQEGEDAADGRAFWQRELAAARALRLPFEGEADAAEIVAPHTVRTAVPEPVGHQLAALARRQDVPLASVLLAGWLTLHHRLTGESGTAVFRIFDGRRFDELQGALGLYARALPVVVQLRPEHTFLVAVSRTDEAVGRAAQWQDYFARLQPLPARAADLPVGFEFQSLPAAQSVSGVRLALLRAEAEIEQLKLSLLASEGSEGLGLEMLYDPRVYGEEAIRILVEQLLTLLASAAARPEDPLSNLQVASEQERLRRVVVFNDTAKAWLAGAVHQLIEEQARRTPESLALICGERRLTYAQMNGRADRLASVLRGLGVGPEIVVGICLERSAETVVALLGVLKAGGAYWAFDPHQPRERLSAMMDDAAPRVLLTRRQWLEAMPPSGATTLVLEELDLSPQSGEEGAPAVPEGALAYLLFTSGSTGRPKGVAVGHRELANYVHGILDWLALPAGASFAMVSTFAADLGNTVLFPALCTGGCLHVVPEDLAADPVAVADLFENHPVDCLKIVPSHLAALLTAPRPERVLPRRLLVVGGEVSHWHWVDQLRELRPECAILNHYGPTETTVGVLVHRVGSAEEERRAATVPLGRPLSNVRVYVLDRELRPVPTGVAGEVHVGGAAVTRGYLGRPEVTAERFLPDPWDVAGGGRLYRTGDLVRFLPGGLLEFIGRADHQIKLHGHRIEAGEIEAVLARHPAVREAVIVLRRDVPGDRRLLAYLVPAKQARPSVEDLRRFLADKLPEVMIPAAFVVLDALPLNANGKVDRAALPAPGRLRPELEQTYVAPRGDVERVLAGLWSEVLGVERVGVQDSFFALGGDSIRSVRIAGLAKEKGLDLTVQQMFRYQTIEELARQVDLQPAPTAATGDEDELARLLEEIEGLSQDEVEQELGEAAPSLGGDRPA
jgi:amino acid adenylation domain-containing protein